MTVHPVEDPDEGIPFPKLRTVRAVGHPNDGDATEWHAAEVPLRRWPHSHILIEDMTFEEKQRLGRHIDRWHFPADSLK